jgi:N utilization substance protein A
MKSDFIIAVTQLAAERHLPREQVMEAIEAGLASAFKKDSFAPGENISVKLDPNTGEISVYTLKTVVEEVEDYLREIALKDALKLQKTAGLGDTVAIEAPSHQASRIGAQTAKQVVLQKLREAERELIYEEFSQRTDDVISGVVDQFDVGKVILLDLGRVQAILPPEEQVPFERYRKGQRLKVYVLEVRHTPKGPEIVVSRSHNNLLKRLFEIEVPEVFNGLVEIKSIAREPGSRSKAAVASRQDGLDPVGSCIGMRGNRIQSIVSELQGEKIDVVRWDKDIKVLIANALSPSEVVHVELNQQDGAAIVVVPERHLSLAIGKEGQNVRLAAKLTGLRLDIKSMSEWGAIKAQLVTAEAETAEEQPALEAEAVEEKVATAATSAVDRVRAALQERGNATIEMLAQDTDLGSRAVQNTLSALRRQGEVEDAGKEGRKKLYQLVKAEVETIAEVKEPALEVETVETPVEAAPSSVEEELAEALLKEDAATTEEAKPTVSPEEELAALAFAEELEEDEEEEEPTEELGEDIWSTTANLSPDAGKIRFAEDILGDFRGGSGRRNKGKGGSSQYQGRGKRRAKGAASSLEGRLARRDS